MSAKSSWTAGSVFFFLIISSPKLHLFRPHFLLSPLGNQSFGCRGDDDPASFEASSNSGGHEEPSLTCHAFMKFP